MAGYYLLIDAGNTRIKWARVEADRLIPGVPFAIRPDLPPEIKAAWDGLEKPLGVALSNVAGEQVEADIMSFIRCRWSLEPFVAQSQSSGFGVTSGYRDPEKLGVDRWLALVAARKRSHQPTVIVDAGSACTIDLLDAAGRHLGGHILPGTTAMGHALANGTHQIQYVKMTNSICLDPGRDTLAGISSGALLALVGAIERVVSDHEVSGFHNPSLLMTGGDAKNLADLLRYPAQTASHLVLEGLWRNYQYSLTTNVFK